MSSRPLAVVLSLSFLSAGPLAAQTLSAIPSTEFLAMPAGEQEKLIRRAVANGIGNNSSRTERDGSPKSDEKFQAGRASANFLRAFFFENPSDESAEPHLKSAAIARVLREIDAAVRRQSPEPFVRVLSGYMAGSFKKYRTAVGPAMTDREQQDRFAYAIAFDQYQVAKSAYQATYADFMSTLDDLRMATSVAKTELLLQRLTLNEPGMTGARFDAEKARIRSTMNDFIGIWGTITRKSLDAALSPVDSAGRPKPLSDVAAEKQRAVRVAEVASSFDSEEVARRIHVAMRTQASVPLEPLLTRYLQDELNRP